MTRTDDRPSTDLTPVVLAGGRSTRFGQANKALATYRGEPILGRVLDVVDAVTTNRPIVAVHTDEQAAEHRAAIDTPAVRFAYDDAAFDGPLAGIAAGAAAAETRWLLVVGCDMPLLSERALSALAQRTGPEVDAVAPTEAGEYHPLHTLYRSTAVGRAMPAAASGAGPRVLLERLDAVRTVPARDGAESPDLARSLTSVDTRADLDELAPRQ